MKKKKPIFANFISLESHMTGSLCSDQNIFLNPQVSVKDRNMVTTTDAERRVVAPAGLQDRIDAAVASVNR